MTADEFDDHLVKYINNVQINNLREIRGADKDITYAGDKKATVTEDPNNSMFKSSSLKNVYRGREMPKIEKEDVNLVCHISDLLVAKA